MRRIKSLKTLILLLFVASILASFYTPPKDKNKLLLEMVGTILDYSHYAPRNLDDDFSKDLYDRYIEQLDYFKVYFTQHDLHRLGRYRDRLDDQIRDDDLTFFDQSIQIFRHELKNTHAFAHQILSKPFDLNHDETLQTNYDSIRPARDQQALRNRWRKRLKEAVVSYVSDAQQVQQDKRKADSTYKPKPLVVLERESRKKALKRYDNLYKHLYEKSSRYWMSVFLNAFAQSFDPHTNYLAPREKKAFDVSLSGQFEGIGARLQDKDGYITVVQVIPGSPSYREGELQANDKIIKVAQGDAEPVNVVGMNIEDAIKLIKGKKGTTVKLTVKKVNGATKVIPIVRDVVQLQEVFAKSAIMRRNGKKYGLIKLPSFYFDINGYNGRNSADDVKKQLQALTHEGVKGVILDLRDNGGGSLQAAVKLAGLFITQGPIVQVRGKNQKTDVLTDRDPSVFYKGPLVVLVNERSASASEIVAAALQDYDRAVIVGSKHTFGKGTVQSFLDIDRFTNNRLKDLKPFGYLKITMSKFYRINGGATQLKGVTPDVQMPTQYTYLKVGEKDLHNAMPWDHIAPVKYEDWNRPIDLKVIKRRSLARIAENSFFSLADKNAKWLKKIKDTDHTLYLGLKHYERAADSLEAKVKTFDALDKYDNKLDFTSPSYEKAEMKTDTILVANRKAWHKSLNKDAYIGESVNILDDISNYTRGGKLARK